MIRLEYEPGDFRALAVEESRLLLGGAEPFGAGVSCCVPQAVDGAPLRRRAKILAVGSVIIGLTAMLAAALLAASVEHHAMPDTGAVFLLMGSCGAFGFGMLFVPTIGERWLTRRHLRTVLGDRWDNEIAPAVQVSLEDTQTYDRLKILADDIGILVCHPEFGGIVVEGVSYRYFIHGADVAAIRMHRNNRTVLIQYRIGGEMLDIAIVPRSISGELRRQTLGANLKLFDKIKQSLQGSDEANGPGAADMQDNIRF